MMAGRSSPGNHELLLSVVSVDVKDWFHILDVPGGPPLEQWDGLPSRVEKDFLRLLDLFARHQATATCFFLGWVAERFPYLVKEAAARGHEIASHGYAHRLVYELSRREFREDGLRAREVLEDLTGAQVRGYRSAGFSVTKKTPWFFDMLIEAGYHYDSSVFRAARGHGGMESAPHEPHWTGPEGTGIFEFPISVADCFGKPVCFFGGGYLRLFPFWLIQRMSHRVLAEGRPVLFYVHPREVDPSHPRLSMSPSRRFKSYVNLHSTEDKLDRILSVFPVTTFGALLDSAVLTQTSSSPED
jgi:polysaccharide deacetylase family protein (PEP-CTERM system associated)